MATSATVGVATTVWDPRVVPLHWTVFSAGVPLCVLYLTGLAQMGTNAASLMFAFCFYPCYHPW
jgi:hypothetical protein